MSSENVAGTNHNLNVQTMQMEDLERERQIPYALKNAWLQFLNPIALDAMTWKHTFGIVTLCAIIGMVLGGSFGFAASKLTPDFFQRIIPWRDIEPTDVATFFGATTGVILGGGLGCFALLIQFMLEWKKNSSTNEVKRDI